MRTFIEFSKFHRAYWARLQRCRLKRVCIVRTKEDTQLIRFRVARDLWYHVTGRPHIVY